MSPGLTFFSPLELGLLSGTALAALSVTACAWFLGHRSIEPRCGRCGYSVHGLEHWTCPECGSDFHDVGIVAPVYRRRRRLLLMSGIWTVCFAVAAGLLYDYVKSMLLPIDEVYEGRLVLDGPTSGAYRQVSLEAHEWRRIDRNTFGSFGGLMVMVKQSGYADTFELTREMTVTLVDLHGEEHEQVIDITGDEDVTDRAGIWEFKLDIPQGLRPVIVKQWFGAAGIDVTSPQVEAEAEAVAQVFQPVPPNELTGTTGVGVEYAMNNFTDVTHDGQWSLRLHPPCVWGSIATPIVVWLVGLYWIKRRA
jgi:hypothetical protein